MQWELLRSNWALALAAAVTVVILLMACLRVFSASASARLRQARKQLAVERRRLRKAEAVVLKRQRRRQSLQQRAESVKPRLLQEAVGRLADAEVLARIARDTVMIAEQRVRQVIHEEFAPAKQARLRSKYLPDSPPDRRPFTF
jgi:hypothetical protein